MTSNGLQNVLQAASRSSRFDIPEVQQHGTKVGAHRAAQIVTSRQQG